MIEKQIHKNYVWLYFVSLFLLWSVRELWLAQYINSMNPVAAAIASAVVKIAVWIVPVVLLVRLVEKRKSFSYLKLTHNSGKGIKWAGWITLAMAAYFSLVNLLFLNSGLNFNLGIDDWLNTFILVGITEEIVFRGFILNKLIDMFKFRHANIITSILFVSIHFPIWIYHDLFVFPYCLSAMAQIFIISIVFGWIYKKTNSLWSVIIIHSMYDLFVTVLN